MNIIKESEPPQKDLRGVQPPTPNNYLEPSPDWALRRNCFRNRQRGWNDAPMRRLMVRRGLLVWCNQQLSMFIQTRGHLVEPHKPA